jgi:hypothetical protein
MKRNGAPKGRVRAEGEYAEGSYFKNNGPMEVMDGQGYRPDPSIHSTETDPGMPKPKAPEVSKKPEGTEDDRNRILTSPLPLVVSAPEAIEKMEMLNDLIKEGRPDLAQASEAVHQAIDNMERLALGDQDFNQHELAEGEVPMQGQSAVATFTVGDRVMMALDDGEYQGEIQKDNGDGTYDVKTDQMATFRRVPAQSIAKPEMLQPIASKEKKMKKALRPKAAKVEDVDPNPDNSAIAERVTEILRANPGLGEAAAKSQAKEELKLKKVGAVVKASKAEVGKTYLESDTEEPFAFRVVDKGLGEAMAEKYPKAWEEAKTKMSYDQYKGFLAGPVCVVLYEGFAPDDLSIIGENYVEGCEETDGFTAKKKLKAAPAVADKGATSPDVATDKAAPVKEGYKLIDGAKIVEENGQPRAFKNSDDVIPAELYADANGKLALVTPDGKANYEESANDEVELAYWKTVHSLIPKTEAKPETAPEATPAPAPKADSSQPAKEAVAASNKKKMKAAKAEPFVPVDPTAAEKILADNKIKASGTTPFFIVATLRGSKDIQLVAGDIGLLDTALADGSLKPEAIQGIFADKPAAERFYAIVGGKPAVTADAKENAERNLDEARKHAKNAAGSATVAEAELGNGHPRDAERAAGSAGHEAEESAYHGRRAEKELKQVSSSKVIATGKAIDLVLDETYAMAIAAAKVAPEAIIVILASKEGVITARLAPTADFKEDVIKDLTELGKVMGNGALEKVLTAVKSGRYDADIAEASESPASASEIADMIITMELAASKVKAEEAVEENKSGLTYKCSICGAKIPYGESHTNYAGDEICASCFKGETQVEASAFDQIPELEIGGGMIAKRKKSEKKEGKEDAGSEIEVVDKDGKIVATYPDAFGDDTVMIIKFLRKVLDIKETDDKKAGKAEDKSESKPEGKEHKKDKGESMEDKPVILPKVKEEKDSKADDEKAKEKEKVEAELKERANWMEARVADARFVVEAMLRKGHVVAIQDDIDSELLAGKTLRQAQEVAARKAVDRKVMDLLAKPETELRVIKASLAHLAVRQVRVQASEGDLALSNLSASGLIFDSPQKTSNIGMAVTAAFRR